MNLPSLINDKPSISRIRGHFLFKLLHAAMHGASIALAGIGNMIDEGQAAAVQVDSRYCPSPSSSSQKMTKRLLAAQEIQQNECNSLLTTKVSTGLPFDSLLQLS
jgi:hypothetical protein